jgi:hypothetical protein
MQHTFLGSPLNELHQYLVLRCTCGVGFLNYRFIVALQEDALGGHWAGKKGALSIDNREVQV